MDTSQVPAYTVTGVQDTTAHESGKGFTHHKRVNVRFADGSTTYVEVPFTPEWVDTAKTHIDELYQQHIGMMSTSGPMVDNPRARTIPLNSR